MKKLSFLFISILIVVILLFLLLFLWFKGYKESFDNGQKKNAFCLLTETPHPIWMEFL